MRLLLDTCTFLWAVAEPGQLSVRAKELFVDPGNEVFLSGNTRLNVLPVVTEQGFCARGAPPPCQGLSVVSCWEIAVKHSLGRLPLHQPPGQLIPLQRAAHGIESLPLDEESALRVARPAVIHGDPFDRMLASQAIVHGLALVPPDKLIARYPVRIFW